MVLCDIDPRGPVVKDMEFEVRVHSAAPDLPVPMNMRMTKRSHTLPALTTQRGSSALRQVPKRYEDTRPAKVQDFSHQRILSELV